MDKLRTSPADAISDLPDGASIAVSGFGPSAGAPFSLLAALNERGTRDICFVGNTIPPGAQTLVEAGRVRHLIVSFTARAGGSSPAEELMRKGELTFELVPQGTLVERLRAAGAGLAAVYTPTGLNTPIADGKEVRYFNGKPYLLETALAVDYANACGGHGFGKAPRLGAAQNVALRSCYSDGAKECVIRTFFCDAKG